MTPHPKRRKREPKGPLVCFDGTMLDVGDTDLAVAASSIVVATKDKEVTGALHFMSEPDANTALEKLKAGELAYVASKEYLDGLPVIGGMKKEWEKLRRLGFIGMEWNFCGHRRAWGLKKKPDGKYEDISPRSYGRN